MTDKPRYVIIYTDGRAENVKEDWTWHLILDRIYNEVNAAGGNTPLPAMLIKDKKIIVANGLHDIGRKYGRRYREARERAVAGVKAEFPEPEAAALGGV